MNQRSNPTKSQELASRLAHARLQQIRAQSNLEHAQERARLAKRRRKEAKQAFRRARKEVKRAKIELGRAEEQITEAEAKLAKTMKIQTRRQPKAERRPQAHARQARPSGLSDKAATQPNRKRARSKHQPTPPQAAEIAPAKVPPSEPRKREESPSIAQTNPVPL